MNVAEKIEKQNQIDIYNDFSDNPLVTVVDKKIILSEEQKIKLIALWNSRSDSPPSLDEMIKYVFGKEYDARSKPAIAIRTFLSERSIDYKSQAKLEKERKSKLTDLTDGQKDYILNNIKDMRQQKGTET